MSKKWFETEMHRNWRIALCIALADVVVLRMAFYVNPLELEQSSGVVIIVAGIIFAMIHHWMDTLHKRCDVNYVSEMSLYAYLIIAASAVIVFVFESPQVAMLFFVAVSILTGMAIARYLRDVYCADEHKSFADIQKSVIELCLSQKHQGGV